jgi:hypothetical protein
MDIAFPKTIIERLKTEAKRKNLSDGIIQHLLERKDHKDDIEGITLFIYEKELKNLSNEIMDVLADLVTHDLLVEHEDTEGKKYYLISDKQAPLKNLLL